MTAGMLGVGRALVSFAIRALGGLLFRDVAGGRGGRGGGGGGGRQAVDWQVVAIGRLEHLESCC